MWRCILPYCTHFAIEKFILGRKAECWGCGKTFFMTQKTLQKKPQCGCMNTGRKVEKVVPRATVEDLMEKLKIGVPSKKEEDII